MPTVETHCAFFFLLRARRIPPVPIPIGPGTQQNPFFNIELNSIIPKKWFQSIFRYPVLPSLLFFAAVVVIAEYLDLDATR